MDIKKWSPAAVAGSPQNPVWLLPEKETAGAKRAHPGSTANDTQGKGPLSTRKSKILQGFDIKARRRYIKNDMSTLENIYIFSPVRPPRLRLWPLA
ncbi:MAG: hypothetical protein ABSG62_15930 [Terracidiphilus sp.]